jgi:hypothetical protein
MYPLLAALAAASILLLIRYLSGQSRRLGILFFLANMAVLATHYYGVFLVVGELLILVLVRPRPLRSWLPTSAACATGIAVLCYVALVLTKQSSGEVYGLGLFALPGVGWSMVTGYSLLPTAEELHVAGVAAVRPFMPYAIAGALPLVLMLWVGFTRLELRAGLLLALLCTCVLMGPFAAHLVFSKISVNPRYFTAAAPVLFVVLAAGIPKADDAWWRKVAALLVILLLLTGTVRHLADPGREREDVNAAGAWLDAHVLAGEEIFVTSDEMASLAYFHWPAQRITQYPQRNTVVQSSGAEALSRGLPMEAGRRSFFVFGRTWLSDPDGALERAVSRDYVSCGAIKVRGIRVYCLLPRS